MPTGQTDGRMPDRYITFSIRRGQRRKAEYRLQKGRIQDLLPGVDIYVPELLIYDSVRQKHHYGACKFLQMFVETERDRERAEASDRKH